MPQKIVFAESEIENAAPGQTVTFSSDDLSAPPSVPATATPGAASWLELATEGVKGLAQGIVAPAVLLKSMYEDSAASMQQAIAEAKQGHVGSALGSTLRSTPAGQSARVLGQMGMAQWDQLVKGKQAYDEGRLSEAMGHTVAGLTPLVGPFAAHVGEEIGSGEPRRAAHAVGTAASAVVPGAVARRLPPTVRIPGTGMFANPNPVEAAAVQYGRQAGIPISAGTATGSAVIRGAQAAGDFSLGGALRGVRARRAEEQALTAESGALAARAHPVPASPETAGAGVRQGLQREIQQQRTTANQQYGTVRTIEQQQGLTIDIAHSKARLRPLYTELAREAELVPLHGARARAYTALDRFMNGPDVEAVTAVDRALGRFKELARAEGGAAAQVVQRLEADVQAAIAQGGPAATAARNAGRAATRAEHDARAILRELREEPVRAYRQATVAGDAGIEYLRDLQRLAPNEMRQIGRAWLEMTFQKATVEGGFGRSDRLFADWQALGPETRAIIFPDAAHRAALDHFFVLQKKMAENVNPSRSALVGGLMAQGWALLNPVTGAKYIIGGNLLARLMRTPGGVRALTEAIQVPTGRTRAAAAAAVSRVAAMAGVRPTRGALPVPAAAEDEATQK